MAKSISAFLDEHGRVTAWPSKRRRAHQRAALEYLAALFEGGRRYGEAEVNALLREHTTLEDFALLRRELVEGDYLARTPDGASYWRVNSRPSTAPHG